MSNQEEISTTTMSNQEEISTSTDSNLNPIIVDEKLTIQYIDQKVIPDLVSLLSHQLKPKILPPKPGDESAAFAANSPANGTRSAKNKANDSSSTPLCGFFIKSNPQNPKSVRKNGNKMSDSNICKSPSVVVNVQGQLYRQFEKLEKDLDDVKVAFDKLKTFEDHVGEKIKRLVNQCQAIVSKFPKGDASSSQSSDEIAAVQRKVRELDMIVADLKREIPLTYKLYSSNSVAHHNLRSTHSKSVEISEGRNVFDKLSKLHNNPNFISSSAFKDFKARYDSLDKLELKLCLLSFSVFPENEIIRRRVLVYWWIGEGFADPEENESAEEIACEYYHQLMKKGFIEPVYKKGVSNSCSMHPFVRSAVIVLAKKAGFFDFDENGTPTRKFVRSHRACLVKPREGKLSGMELEKVYTVFNLNEDTIGFELDWFQKMKYVKVLCLGRWKCLATHHIEVDKTDFLNGLKGMKHLRYLSLQGVSRIDEVPDSISKLHNLRVLDLRACHNLEVLPKEIEGLKKLTHFDLSECYLIDDMPKWLASLPELQVLKGFVVGDPESKYSCTISDLTNLKWLRKLSITTGRVDFPAEKELNAFSQFKALRRLTIAWGGELSVPSNEKKTATGADQENNEGKAQVAADNKGTGTKQDGGGIQSAKTPTQRTISIGSALKRTKTLTVCSELPLELEKLDLRCFPKTPSPTWLMPSKLTKLKKLYIRGGNLCDLGQCQEIHQSWSVTHLRLKYLNALAMDWEELRALFPNLKYLEKVKCPNLTFFPCDQSGVWESAVPSN